MRAWLTLFVVFSGCAHAIVADVDERNAESFRKAFDAALAREGVQADPLKRETLGLPIAVEDCTRAGGAMKLGAWTLDADCQALRASLFQPQPLLAHADDGTTAVLVLAGPSQVMVSEASGAFALTRRPDGRWLVLMPVMNAVSRRTIVVDQTCNLMPSPIEIRGGAENFWVIPESQVERVELKPMPWDGIAIDIKCTRNVY